MAAGPISERNQGNWGRRAQDGPRMGRGGQISAGGASAGVGGSAPPARAGAVRAGRAGRVQAGARDRRLLDQLPDVPRSTAKQTGKTPSGRTASAGTPSQTPGGQRVGGFGASGRASFAFPLPRTLFLTFCSLASDATVYVGGLDEKVSEPLLWELFLQAGPVVNTHMPKDRVTGQHQGEYWARSSPAWGSRPRQGLLSARASHNSWAEQPAGFFPLRLSSQFASGVFSQL